MTLFSKVIKIFSFILLIVVISCGDTGAEPNPGGNPDEASTVSVRNLKRAMELTDSAIDAHFYGSGMTMARYYNPYTSVKSDEVGSIWMYTSAIEAVNAIMHALKLQKDKGDATLYDANFSRYAKVLADLYDNADFYKGTFELTSYTQTKQWSVYGVNRGSGKGSANVAGIMNVYDDQMWFIRELLESYKITGVEAYREKAEYLTEYVLDGWDCSIGSNGEEYGGITWGPGYVTKHSCSNGPMISPLVWLHEIYKGKDDQITRRFIDPTDKLTRKTEQLKKSDYYLGYAKKVYAWQKKALMRSEGVYNDLMGGCSPGNPETITISGVTYRKGINCRDQAGPAISYNSGSMLSGAADLSRATGLTSYNADLTTLSDKSFEYFAKLGGSKAGYYSYDISGFNNWFNGILMRGYVDAATDYPGVSKYLETFQTNLDYGYDNFLYEGFLPTNILVGWSRDNNNNRTEGMFNFAFAAEYAVLAKYAMENE